MPATAMSSRQLASRRTWSCRRSRKTIGSIVSIYATGAGPADAAGNVPVSVYFDDVPADVLGSVALTQYPGLWQINARVPAGVSGQVPVFVVAGNLASNAVTVAVR